MTTIVLVENLDYNYVDLNSLKKSKWKNFGIKASSSDGRHNNGGFHHKNNWHVPLKPPLRPSFNSKN
jgi:hypothetical protein